MSQEYEPVNEGSPALPPDTAESAAQAEEDGVNGTRCCLADALRQHTAEQDGEIEGAKVILRQKLSDEDWRQVEEACVQNPRGFLVFRDLISSADTTTFNTFLSASPVYRENDKIFEVFEEFARNGITIGGDNSEEAVSASARATNSIIFLAKTRSFHLGNPKVFNLLAEIARRIDVTKFLPSLYEADENAWSIVFICLNASHTAKMHEAEEAFKVWFNASRTTLLSR